jgi:5'-methylthioadenosine phosphorylase
VTAPARANVAVIGGTGFYEFLSDPVDVVPHTPYGAPSGPINLGNIEGRPVAFLPRHGPGHQFPPHRVNYRANLWALRELGVTRVFGPCAVGSLRPDVHPGEFVVLDQLVDRTWGRPDTFLDGPTVQHVSFADPYCPELSQLLVTTAEPGVHPNATAPVVHPNGTVPVVHPNGTVVVIPGPRFATRAESAGYRASGWDVINMTQYPEVYLARELGMCYAGLALVTDYDTGVEGDPDSAPVTMEAVMAVLAANVTRAANLLRRAVPLVAPIPTCACATTGAAQFRR